MFTVLTDQPRSFICASVLGPVGIPLARNTARQGTCSTLYTIPDLLASSVSTSIKQWLLLIESVHANTERAVDHG